MTVSLEIRELTPYEKAKWCEDGFFKAPEFLTYGDELGRLYDSLAELASDSMISNGLQQHIRVELLDMYYYQTHLYTGTYGGYDDWTAFGLPPKEEFLARAGKTEEVLMSWGSGSDWTDRVREAWDWAMKWREEHIHEFTERSRIEYHQRELERLKGN